MPIIKCNSVTKKGNKYIFFNGDEGTPNFECGTQRGKIKRKKVKSVEEDGSCNDGKKKFIIHVKNNVAGYG